MASFAEIEAQLEAPTPSATGAAAQAQSAGFFESIGTGLSDIASGVFDFGSGALFGLLDMLDRPGRALRHLIAGDPGQALSSILTPLLPKFLEEAVGLEESDPIGFSEILGELGVTGLGEEGVTGLGITGRGMIGFALDVLTDPLTYFGAPVGRLLALSSRNTIRGMSNTARAGILKAERLVRRPGETGVLQTLVAGERAARKKVTAGAAGVRDAFGDAFVKDFKIKRKLRLEGKTTEQIENIVALDREMLRQYGSKEIQGGLTSMQIETVLANEAAQELGVSAGSKAARKLGTARSKEVLDFREIPGATEQILADNFDAVQEGLFEGATARGREAVGAARAQPGLRGGKEVTNKTVEEIWGKFTPAQQDMFKLGTTGDPRFAQLTVQNPGPSGINGLVEDVINNTNVGRTQRYVDMDHLQREAVEDLLRQTGNSYVGHFRTKGQVADYFELMLRKVVPDVDGITDAQQLLDKATRFASKAQTARAGELVGKATLEAQNALKARKLMGSLKEIEATVGPIFERTLGGEFRLAARRFNAVETVDNFFRELQKDPELFAILPKGAEAAPGMVRLELSKLPPSIANLAKKAGSDAVSMSRALWDEVGGKGGFLQRMVSLSEGDGLLKALRTFNKWYKPWTLAHPATAVRDMFGDVFLNMSAGVGPTWYFKAREAYSAYKKFRKGEDISGITIRVAGENVPAQKIVNELIDTAIPGNALAHSEFFIRQFDEASAGTARRVWAMDPQQNSWTAMMMGFRGSVADHGRIAHYLHRRFSKISKAQGTDRLDLVAQSVKKHLYDASELTNFERGVMKEVFPFYSFLRQNVPNMMKKALTGSEYWVAPKGLQKLGIKALGPNLPLIVGRQKFNLDKQNRADIPDDLFPTFLQGHNPNMAVGKDENGRMGVWSFNGWLPIDTLIQADSPQKFLKLMFNTMTPLAKVPVEVLFNVNSFFEKELERYPGQREHIWGVPVNKKVAHVMRSVRLINSVDREVIPIINKIVEAATGRPFLTGTERMQDLLGQQEFGALVTRALTGIKVRSIDLSRAKIAATKRLTRERGKLKTSRRFANKDKDWSNVSQLDRLIADMDDRLRALRGFQPIDHPGLFSLTLDSWNNKRAG